jgi:hypothetical protein
MLVLSAVLAMSAGMLTVQRVASTKRVCVSELTGVSAGVAGSLVNCLAAANQEVPKDVVELAKKDAYFRKAGGRGRGGARGGRGRGRSQVRVFIRPLTAHILVWVSRFDCASRSINASAEV